MYIFLSHFDSIKVKKDIFILVREPVIGLIMWLRPNGLKVCSYVEKYAEFKNQTLIKIRWYTNWLYAKECPRGDPYHK